MQNEETWEQISETGGKIRKSWQSLADKYGLENVHWGHPTLTGFTFKSQHALAYKTLITQEMLKKGYMAGISVYVCIEHTAEIVGMFFDALDPIFGKIKECEEGRDVMSLLKGPICHSAFRRLN